jgi:hypothetical protein
MKASQHTPQKIEVIGDGTDTYIVVDGVKIAKRGKPNTPQARTWVSIEPGWRVFDNADMSQIVIEHDGVRVH